MLLLPSQQLQQPPVPACHSLQAAIAPGCVEPFWHSWGPTRSLHGVKLPETSSSQERSKTPLVWSGSDHSLEQCSQTILWD